MTWQREIDIAVDLERRRADEEKKRADEAEARANKYEKMLRDFGKLQSANISKSTILTKDEFSESTLEPPAQLVVFCSYKIWAC